MIVSMSWTYVMLYFPLLLAVSAVVGACRHEQKALIWDQTWRTTVWITGFLLVSYVVLQVVSWML